MRNTLAFLTAAGLAASSLGFTPGTTLWQSYTANPMPGTARIAPVVTYSFIPDTGTCPNNMDTNGDMINEMPNYAIPGGGSQLYGVLDGLFAASATNGDLGAARVLWQSLVFESANRWTTSAAITLDFTSVNDLNSAMNWDDDCSDPELYPVGSGTFDNISLDTTENGTAPCDDQFIANPMPSPFPPCDAVPAAPGGGIGPGNAMPGDIRIAMATVTLDGPGGAVFIVNKPNPDNGAANAFSVGGNILLDPAEPWANPSNNFRFFRNNITKAFGLAIGLQEMDACPGFPRIMNVGVGGTTANQPAAANGLVEPAFTTGPLGAPQNGQIATSADLTVALPIPAVDPMQHDDFVPAVRGALTGFGNPLTSLDDLRAAHHLYQDDGQAGQLVNAMGMPTALPVPAPATLPGTIIINPQIALNLGNLTGQGDFAGGVFASVSNGGPNADINDLYTFLLAAGTGQSTGTIDADITVTATPIGGLNPLDEPPGFGMAINPVTGGTCAGTFDSSAVEPLRVTLFDGASNVLATNTAAAGGQASFTVNVTQLGQFFIVVDAPTGAVITPQLYLVNINVVNRRFEFGLPVSDFILDGNPDPRNPLQGSSRDEAAFLPGETPFGILGPLSYGFQAMFESFVPAAGGHAVDTLLAAQSPDGTVGYTGDGVRIGVIHTAHPAGGHETFAGRDFERISWGTDFATGDALPGFENVGARAVNNQTAIPLAAVAMAAGSPIGGTPSAANPGGGFRGVAPGAEIVSGSIAQDLFGDPTGERFRISEEALLFTLLGMAAPDALRDEPGGEQLPAQPVDIILNTWGVIGDLRADGRTALLYEYIADQFDVIVVAAAGGNVGVPDNSLIADPAPLRQPIVAFPGSFSNDQDGFFDNGFIKFTGVDSEDALGGATFGWRTVFSPATAFNVISVGSVGAAVNANPDNVYAPTDALATDPEFLIRNTPLDIDVNFTTLDTVPQFSARGTADVFNFEDGMNNFNVRQGIDLLAVGAGLILRDFNIATDPTRPDMFMPEVSYLGHTTEVDLNVPFVDFIADPGGTDAIVPDLANIAQTYTQWSGTELSAGVVAGAFATLLEAARDNITAGVLPTPFAAQPLVLKSVVLNNARRTHHWSNEAIIPGFAQDFAFGTELRAPTGPVFSFAFPSSFSGIALDSFQGAGVLDVGGAYENLIAGYTFDPNTPPGPGTPAIIWPEFPTVGPDNREGITRDVVATNPAIPTVVLQPIGTQSGLTEDDTVITPGGGPDPITEPDPGSDEGQSSGGSGRKGRTGSVIEDPVLVGGSPPRAGGNTDTEPRAGFNVGPLGGPGGGGAGPVIPTPPGPTQPSTPTRIISPIVVQPMGWDFGNIGFVTANGPALDSLVYIIDTRVFAGDIFEATLVWNRTVGFSGFDFSDPEDVNFGELNRLELEDLTLRVFSYDPSQELFTQLEGQTAIGASNSEFATVEQIVDEFAIEDFGAGGGFIGGFIVMVVTYNGQVYDLFDNNAPGQVEFGLSWRLYPNPSMTAGTRAALIESFDKQTRVRRVLQSIGARSGEKAFDPIMDRNADGRVDISDLLNVISTL